MVQLLKISDFGSSKKSSSGFFSLSSHGFETMDYLGPELLRVFEGSVTGPEIKVANASDNFLKSSMNFFAQCIVMLFCRPQQ